VTSTLAQTFL